MTCYGLYYYNQHTLTPLPLLQVRASASIKDLSATVQLSQDFTNDSDNTIECSYGFPVPARASVTAFSLLKSDGTRIFGIVQEKDEAKETYEKAVEEGKLASLMEQQTPDTFAVSVGNLLPHEKVTVELSYSTELTEDETNNSIRFHLPAHLGARYGEPPASKPSSVWHLSLSPSTDTSFLHLDLAIESVSPISQIGSPSHTISTSLGPDHSLPNAAELPFSNFARVTFSSDTTLVKDFILTMQSSGLDAPRCLAEIHPEHDTAALSLSLVPKFKLPEIESQEYLFLVDRSGSMGGERIAMARKALIVLLRSLPKQGTNINIVSFGSHSSALWSKGSCAYSQATLEEATKHIDGMDADFGGTEMRLALEATFSMRMTTTPTSIFVLTDGDAWDLEGVNPIVSSAVASAPATAPLRVFVLGIGNSASTAMCEGMARVGHGAAQFVVDGESFTGKTVRLLKAARSPQLLNIRLELPESAGVGGRSKLAASGKDEEEFELVNEEKAEVKTLATSTATLSLFDEAEDPLAAESKQPFVPAAPIDLPPPPPIQQAPHTIQNLFPGTGLHAYLILTPASLLPESIFLRAELAWGQKLELEVPVVVSQLPSTGAPPPIHALAARKLIQDLEDGRHALKVEGNDEGLLERAVKASIVRLGKSYSLASKHTSFVAVDESEVDVRRKQVAQSLVCRVESPVLHHQLYAQPTGWGTGAAPRMAVEAKKTGGGGGVFGGMGARLFGSWAAAPPPLRTIAAPMMLARGGAGAMFSSPAPGSGGGLMRSMAAPPPCPAPAVAACYSPPPLPTDLFVCPPPPPAGGAAAPLTYAAWGSPASVEIDSPPPTSTDLTPSDRIDALARLQNFDGSFLPSAIPLCTLSSKSTSIPTPTLAGILTHLARIRIAPLARFSALEEGERDRVVATAVVLAFWEKRMGGVEEEWEGMAGKAREFGEELVGEDEFEQLRARVSGLV